MTKKSSVDQRVPLLLDCQTSEARPVSMSLSPSLIHSVDITVIVDPSEGTFTLNETKSNQFTTFSPSRVA